MVSYIPFIGASRMNLPTIVISQHYISLLPNIIGDSYSYPCP